MAVALHGNLRDFGLAEVFQLIGQQRKTGALWIEGRDLTMRLLFADGAVVSAAPDGPTEHMALGDMMVRCGLITRDVLLRAVRESESSARPLPTILVDEGAVSDAQVEEVVDLLTGESVFQVLRWTVGSFRFTAQAVPHERPPEKLLAAEQILMDGLRMVDEWQTFAEQVPSGDVVFERTGSFSVYRQQARGESAQRLDAAERLFHLVDGRASARRVIDLSRLGTFEGTRILAELRRAGLVSLVESRRGLARPSAGSGGRSWLPALGRAAAAVLPLVWLGLVVAALLGVVPGVSPELTRSAPSASGIPIERAPFETARQDYETRRLRHAVEVHRYLHGSWPAALETLRSPAGDGALTTSAPGSYYYSRVEDGVIVLAPER